jgi:hypothetical protein
VTRRVALIPRVILAVAITISAGCNQSWNGGVEGAPLNPDRHRAHIVAIDKVLFQNGPLKASDRPELEQEILAIADAASADPDNTIALELSLDLRLLSTMATSDTVHGPVANSELTRQWRHIRGSLFHDAAWFRRSAADPVASAVPEPPVTAPKTREAHSHMR